MGMIPTIFETDTDIQSPLKDQISRELIGETPVSPGGASCIFTDDIIRYKILSDSLIELTLRVPEKDLKNSDQAAEPPETVLMSVGNNCPQLAFHNYLHYVPLDGLLCAERDTVQSRSGESCTITALTGQASVITQPLDLPEPSPLPKGQGPR